MTKSFILLLILISVGISVIAQNNYCGKYYIAQLSATSKELTNGGCMIYKHCVLKFDKDSVEVSYPTKASCNPTVFEFTYNSNNYNLKKKYKWTVASDKLVITGFKDYNKYSFQEKDSNFVKTLYPKENKYYLANIMTARTKEPCLESKYCVLKFYNDSVEAMYFMHKSCPTIKKNMYEFLENQSNKYQWEIANGKISIPKFEKYSEYKFEEKDEYFIKTLFPQANTKNNLNDSLNLKGIVKMENSNEFLPFATIELKNNRINTYSNVDGIFILKVKNSKSLKFPDTLQINYAGLKPDKIAVNSMEEIRTIFNLSNSFSLNQVEPIDTIQEGPYPTFTIKEPRDGYIQVVPAKKIKKKRKQVNSKNK